LAQYLQSELFNTIMCKYPTWTEWCSFTAHTGHMVYTFYWWHSSCIGYMAYLINCVMITYINENNLLIRND
jgi:hypothetical protein